MAALMHGLGMWDISSTIYRYKDYPSIGARLQPWTTLNHIDCAHIYRYVIYIIRSIMSCILKLFIYIYMYIYVIKYKYKHFYPEYAYINKSLPFFWSTKLFNFGSQLMIGQLGLRTLEGHEHHMCLGTQSLEANESKMAYWNALHPWKLTWLAGKSPIFLIGYTSSNGGCSIVMLVFWRGILVGNHTKQWRWSPQGKSVN